MTVFKKSGNWAGTSYNKDTGNDDENHESELPFEEVTRLVAASVAVFPKGAVPGDGGAVLGAFRDALQSETAEIEIVKGIHQRNTEPHIRASLVVDGERHHFHVVVRTGTRVATAVNGRAVPASKQRFVWEPVQVSVALGEGEDRKVYKYPAADPAPGYGARKRGLSFTQGQLELHIVAASAAAAERERLAKEKAEKEAIESAARLEAAEAQRLLRMKSGGSPWATLKK